MGYVLLILIAVVACIPMLLGSKKFRPCYKGCHGCGKCMKGFEIRPSAGEKEPPVQSDEEKNKTSRQWTGKK